MCSVHLNDYLVKWELVSSRDSRTCTYVLPLSVVESYLWNHNCIPHIYVYVYTYLIERKLIDTRYFEVSLDVFLDRLFPSIHFTVGTYCLIRHECFFPSVPCVSVVSPWCPFDSHHDKRFIFCIWFMFSISFKLLMPSLWMIYM